MSAVKPLVFARIAPRTDSDSNSFRVPKPRSGHRIVCDYAGNIYSIGGYNPSIDSDEEGMDEEWANSRPLFKELWKYCPTTRTWSQKQTTGGIPEHLASHSAVFFNGNLIVFGGTGVPFGTSSSNEVFVCDLNTYFWKSVEPTNPSDDINIPPRGYGQGIVIDPEDECLYVVGGTNGFIYSIDIYKFCLKTRTWTEMYRKRVPGDYPEERYRHEVVLYRNQLLIMGGGTSTECFGFTTIPVFELTTRTWRPQNTIGNGRIMADTPSARRCHGCVQMGSDVFIFGGTDGLTVFDDLWKLNLNSYVWTRFDLTMPIPLFFHGAALADSGRLTIFGGVKEINPDPDVKTRTNDMFEIWLNIPSLQEMAWNIFLSNCDINDLAKCSYKGLQRYGIPRNYMSLLRETIREPDTISAIPLPY